MLTKEEMLTLLKEDVVPALGCTEPVCVAICAAQAAQAIGGELEKIEVQVNANIYKNGMSAGIPNFNKVGLKYAAALGACLKNPEKRLELLQEVTDCIRTAVEELVNKKAVSVSIDEAEKGLYVRSVVTTSLGTGECIIRDGHTNIVLIKKNEQVVFEKKSEAQKQENSLVDALVKMSIVEIKELVESATEEELLFMLEGVEMNEMLAAYSEENKMGVGIADTWRKNIGGSLLADDLMSRILLKVSSAAESRLDGCPYPTMSSSGAGTKGLVVILPISETADAIGASREKKVKALAFGHLVNRYINAYIGKLSAMCTCAMASSTAAAAAMAWLLGGTKEQIGAAIRNMTGTITGMICDGGKVGCAMKVSMTSVAALMSAMTAVNDAKLRVSDGVCATTPEECIQNIAKISNPGMLQADKEILDIMLQKEV